MKLGRVIGTMVATIKPEAMKGLKLLIVRPLTADLRDDGEPFVATDASAQASSGDLVTWEASREAALLHEIGLHGERLDDDIGRADDCGDFVEHGFARGSLHCVQRFTPCL